MEPITIFSRSVDPYGVIRRLRALIPTVEIDGTAHDWRHAVVRLRDGDRAVTLTFGHDPAYYAEPNWTQQMRGLRGYLSMFQETSRKTMVMMLTTTFKFALSTSFEPDVESRDDVRLSVLHSVVQYLDGIIWKPSYVVDAHGRILFGAGGEKSEDPNAVWPRVLGEVSA